MIFIKNLYCIECFGKNYDEYIGDNKETDSNMIFYTEYKKMIDDAFTKQMSKFSKIFSQRLKKNKGYQQIIFQNRYFDYEYEKELSKVVEEAYQTMIRKEEKIYKIIKKKEQKEQMEINDKKKLKLGERIIETKDGTKMIKKDTFSFKFNFLYNFNREWS